MNKELLDVLHRYDGVSTSLKAKQSLLTMYLLEDDENGVNEVLKEMKVLVKDMEELRKEIFSKVLNECETDCPEECKVFLFRNAIQELREYGTVEDICKHVLCAEGAVVNANGVVIECRDKRIVEVKEVVAYD